jgi:integrase
LKVESAYGYVTVYTRRHINGCKLTETTQNSCSCPKYHYVVPNDKSLQPKPPQVSAKTPSYKEAINRAQQLVDFWDPKTQEIARLKAEKQRTEVSIERAVSEYLADCEDRLGRNSTWESYLWALGGVGEDRTNRAASLLNWLDNYNAILPPNQRVTLLEQVDGTVLRAWRQSWKKYKSSTKKQLWVTASTFFAFCFKQGWFNDKPNPVDAVASPVMGNDAPCTGIFGDDQWHSFLAAIDRYQCRNVARQDMHNFFQRQRTFWELVRWSGMSLVDAVQFSRSSVDASGTFVYHRQKLSKKSGAGWATIKLPQHVLELLKYVPLERDSFSADQPFLFKGVKMHSVCVRWRNRFDGVCKAAGITALQTGTRGRTQKPHPHALRDTFAVWMLRKTRNVKFVSKCLGHANSIITERTYLPWAKELEDAHLAMCDEALRHVPQPPKLAPVVAIT